MLKPHRLSLLYLALVGTTSAASITIVNSDFETGGFATDRFSNSPGVVPSGWSAVGAMAGDYFGYYNPGFDYPGTWGGSSVIANMAGPNVFYFGSLTHGQGIQQTLSSTFATDTNYTLTVAVGGRFEAIAYMAALDLRLMAGSTVLASRTVRNTENAGTFIDFALDYTYSPSHAFLTGQQITIQLVENNSEFSGEMEVDNIRLESLAAIPEPASAALVAAASLVLVAGVRRRPRH